MNMPDHEPKPVEALANASRAMAPSAGFTDRTLGALSERGLVHSAPTRNRRALIAAAWFIAGIGTGAVAMDLWRGTSRTAAPVIASVDPNDFVEWY